jgi:hypothetical protein
MEIRAIRTFELEAARLRLRSAGWERGVANPGEFRQLDSRSQQALVAVESGARASDKRDA